MSFQKKLEKLIKKVKASAKNVFRFLANLVF